MTDVTAAWTIATLFACAGMVAPLREAALDRVEKKSVTLRDFRLESGVVLPEAIIAYETYGTLAPDRRNAVLIGHGFTGNPHAAGRYAADDAEAGWWDGVIGPGKAIDTGRFFVLSTNMLGSSYGSTNPASLDPRTGKPYGPDFPVLSVVDIVTAQKKLLDALGITHLVAVGGPSYGGYQTFQWGVTFPEMMDGLIVVVSAPKGAGNDDRVVGLKKRLAADPHWNGGWYYDQGGVAPVMTALRRETLKRYGYGDILAETYPEDAARDAAIERLAASWAKEFDANSMLTLAHAAAYFDAEKDFARIRAKLLYVLSTTDQLFPATIAPQVMAKLSAAGVDATYVELESRYGHMASRVDAAKWAPALKAFMDRLTAARS